MASKKAYGALLLGAASLACGPSFQAMYECDVHFEHCYALDMSHASNELKTACWQDWLGGFTYGQSRDRIEYAKSRVQGTAPACLPGTEAGASDGTLALAASTGNRAVDPPGPVAATPSPTNAFSTPLRVIDSASVPPDAGARATDAGPADAEPPKAPRGGAPPPRSRGT